jgi:hypothetical protein
LGYFTLPRPMMQAAAKPPCPCDFAFSDPEMGKISSPAAVQIADYYPVQHGKADGRKTDEKTDASEKESVLVVV